MAKVQEPAEATLKATWRNTPTQTINAGDVQFANRLLGPSTGVPVVFLTHLAAVLDNWDPRVVDGIAAQNRFANPRLARQYKRCQPTADLIEKALDVLKLGIPPDHRPRDHACDSDALYGRPPERRQRDLSTVALAADSRRVHEPPG